MTEVEQEMFKTTVKELLQLGWKVIYADQKKEKAKATKGKEKEEEEDEEVEVNEPFSIDPKWGMCCVTDAIVKEKDTQPPKHFNEGTLLRRWKAQASRLRMKSSAMR